MTIVFFVILLTFLLLSLLSKGKYDEYLEPLDKKEYPLKQFYPAVLYLLEKIRYKYTSRYDQNTLIRVAEISGHKYSFYYLKIHWANKLIYMFLGAAFLALVGISMGPDTGFIIFVLVLLGLLFYLADGQLKDRVAKRRLSVQLEFPEFINKLTLLINAGMTVSRAWEKIVEDSKSLSPLMNELAITLAEIKAGKSEQQAYEDFAKRCRIKEITKFVTVVIQNLRKGGAEMVSVLRLQSSECWEMRKAAAKRLGEESSTKMLLPLMMMFLAILLIVATPAVLSMRM